LGILDISYKSIIRFALPIIFGAFIQSLILFVDSAFLSAYDTGAFSAVGNAGLLFISFSMLGMGLSDSGQIFMARMYGAQKFEALKSGFQSNVINLLIGGVGIFILVSLLNRFALPYVFKSSIIAEHATDYLGVRAIGFILAFLTLAVTSYFVGIGKSKILMFNTLILCGINVFLDYSLIFGNFGLPRMGAEGAAWATVIAEFCVCIFSWVYLYKLQSKSSKDPSRIDTMLLKKWEWRKYEGKAILKMAIPLMIQGFVAVGAWTSFFFMIEQMGEHDLEVSQIIHKAYFIALIPMIGFAATIKTYVSQYMANKDFVLIKRVIKRIMLVNYLGVILLIHGFILYPDFWIGLIDQQASPEVASDARVILWIISGSILIHCMAMLLQNAIAGSGDTMAAMWIEFLSIFIYLISVYYFIFVLELDIKTVWLAEYIYFSVFLLLAALYYKSGKWQNKTL